MVSRIEFADVLLLYLQNCKQSYRWVMMHRDDNKQSDCPGKGMKNTITG